MSAVLDRVELLACPRRRRAELRGDTLLAPRGTSTRRSTNGAPVLVHPDLAPMQLGYWATPEEVERAGDQAPAPTGGSVDPYVAELIVATHGNLYRVVGPLRRYPIPAFPVTAPRGTRLLDLGCNWGRWSIAAARAGFSVVGVDPSVEAIAAAARVARQLGEDVSYAVGDARRLPFPDATFEVVFSFSVLQHFHPAAFEEAVDEIGARARPARPRLRPDGERVRAEETCSTSRSGAGRGIRSTSCIGGPSEVEWSFGRIGSCLARSAWLSDTQRAGRRPRPAAEQSACRRPNLGGPAPLPRARTCGRQRLGQGAEAVTAVVRASRESRLVSALFLVAVFCATFEKVHWDAAGTDLSRRRHDARCSSPSGRSTGSAGRERRVPRTVGGAPGLLLRVPARLPGRLLQPRHEQARRASSARASSSGRSTSRS